MKPDYSHQKIAILGYGTEGQALYTYLSKHRAKDITICDRSTKVISPKTGSQPRLKTGSDYLSDLNQYDLIFRSPGIPPFLPEIKTVLAAGSQFSSLTKLFFQHCPAPIIAITGSNGKTTTTSLIAHLLRENLARLPHRQVWESGNDRAPILDQLTKITPQDIVVLELSSFQLYDLEVSPHIAVITNLAANHLDWHPDMADYARAKSNIFCHQQARDHYFINDADEGSRVFANHPSRGRRQLYHEREGTVLASSLPYLTHPANLAAAYKVATLLGLTDQQIRAALQTFHLPEQRLELVATACDVMFYNSSSATTPESTACDLRLCRRLQRPTVLIVGGKNKGMPFTAIALAIKETQPRAIILIGQVARELRAAILSVTPSQEIQLCTTLEEATTTAHHLAAPGGAVLFSPGFASFDMFENSKQRGKLFAQYVQQLKPLLTAIK